MDKEAVQQGVKEEAGRKGIDKETVIRWTIYRSRM